MISIWTLVNGWWFALIALVFLSVIAQTPWFKGWLGEFSIRLLTRLRLDKRLYHRFHNVLLETPDGSTQIDHMFVSKYGVFVVETKNMKGWIFGGEMQDNWTQQIYKRKYPFQNPLRQNYKHEKALENLLDIPPEAIHSVVAFVGAATFKTSLPENVVYGYGLIPYIKSKTRPLLSETQVEAAVSSIASAKLKTTRQAEREHVRRLQSRSDPNSEQYCPKCGSRMVLRTAKKGRNKGTTFWGCSQFPKCRMIKSIA